MSDARWGARRFRAPYILDEEMREGLAIEVDTSLSAKRVIRVKERVGKCRDLPRTHRIDNGPDLLAREFVERYGAQGIELRHIQPGKPDQNALIWILQLPSFNEAPLPTNQVLRPVPRVGAGMPVCQ